MQFGEFKTMGKFEVLMMAYTISITGSPEQGIDQDMIFNGIMEPAHCEQFVKEGKSRPPEIFDMETGKRVLYQGRGCMPISNYEVEEINSAFENGPDESYGILYGTPSN
jgi:hypothetical protein